MTGVLEVKGAPVRGSTSAFPAEVYRARMAQARTRLEARGLSALVVFAPESHYYLFGYDGGGYVFFQCAVLSVRHDEVVLLCRPPDVAQAEDTSLIDRIEVWRNAPDADPAVDLREIVVGMGLAGTRLGIELDNHGCTGATFSVVAGALDGICEHEDASDIVRSLRVVKADAELALVARAGGLADDAVRAVREAASPGVLDSVLTAAAMSAMLTGGGDVPPAGPLVNSGPRALYGRGVGGARALEDPDQIMIELSASYRRYNACIERTVLLGVPSSDQRRMHEVVSSTLRAMIDAFRPGEPLGRVDEIHRSTLDAAGFASQRYAACGYSLGATFRPSWMDAPPMIFTGNSLEMVPGMVFFPHVMLGDRRTGFAMGLGETVVVTEGAPTVLSDLGLDLIVVA